MVRAQSKGGRHVRDTVELDDKTRKRQKTADELLITMRKQTEANKREKLKSELHFTKAGKANRHVLFVDELNSFDAAARFDTHPDLVDLKHNRLTTTQLETVDLPSEESGDEKYAELAAHLKKEDELEGTLFEVQKDKELMVRPMQRKGKHTLVDEDQRVYKWFRERRR